MHIITLTIRRFRNLEALAWHPSPRRNLIWGDNGQGKTNLLEAIAMALTGRSFRTSRDADCLPWPSGGDASPLAAGASVAAEVQTGVGRRDVELRLAPDGTKRILLDGRPLRRVADLWGTVSAVVFTPEDVYLFQAPPAVRRRWLDATLVQTLHHAYLEPLQRYGQALRQLNAVLKTEPDERQAMRMARAFYPALAEAAAVIQTARAARLGGATASLGERFARLGGAGRLSLHYAPHMPMPPEADAAPLEALRTVWMERFERAFAAGRRLGACPVGPQRDDFTVQLDGRDLRRYGSQGQHRLAALTLKLEAADWIAARTGEGPILLLDDFGSELDPARREAVLAGLPGAMQVFVTATRPEDLGPGNAWDETRCVRQGGWADA